MVPSAHDEPCVWQFLSHSFESLDHELKPLVCSPFSKCENAVLRIASPGKIRVFRSGRENAVRAQVDIVAPIFFVQDLAISRHKNRDRIRQKKHSGRDCSSQTICARVPHAGIL